MTTVDQSITRSDLRDELRHYATKSDLRDELRHYATKTDLAQLRAEMSGMETRLVKWMIGVMFGGAALASSLALVLERLLS